MSVTVSVTLGDFLIMLTILGSAGAVIWRIGGRLGRIEGWVEEARDRFNRIETKVDRLVERAAQS